MSETANLLETAFETWQFENAKFERGNNSAGTRARKALQEMSVLAKIRRAEISSTRNERKEARV